MKRRDFLLAATGATVATWSSRSIAQPVPCPPPKLSVSGGSATVGICLHDAAADWSARITRPGVRWFHTFDTEDEVTKYRSVDSVSQVSRVASGGVDGGGYLECRPVDRGDGTYAYTDNSWKRPFTADPYAGGWPGPSSPNWNYGYYADPRYHVGFERHYDGHEFYIQMAVRIGAARADGTSGGKTIWIAKAQSTTPDAEVIFGYRMSGTGPGGRGYLGGAHAFNKNFAVDHPKLTSYMQYGGDWQEACTYNDQTGHSCWQWPAYFGRSEWVTFLVHFKTGTDIRGTSYQGIKPGADSPLRDSLIEIYVAESGRYRKIIGGLWNLTLSNDLTSFNNIGHNALWCTNYQNQYTEYPKNYYTQDFDQIIFFGH